MILTVLKIKIAFFKRFSRFNNKYLRVVTRHEECLSSYVGALAYIIIVVWGST